jgi:phosphoserine phosphatase
MKKLACVVLDFDGVCTSQNVPSLWVRVDKAILRGEYRERNDAFREKYSTLHRESRLTEEQQREWIGQSFSLYRDGAVTLAQINASLQGITLRRGVLPSLLLLKKARIPVSIVSWGSADFIEEVLRKNYVNHLVDAVYAARMTHDGERVTGMDPATIVIPANKGAWSMRFARKHGVPHDRILAITDSVRDYRIGCMAANRLGVADITEEFQHLAEHQAFGNAILLQREHFSEATQWIFQRLKDFTP